MRFIIVFKNGKRAFGTINAPDADVAAYIAEKKLGFKNVSHAIPA